MPNKEPIDVARPEDTEILKTFLCRQNKEVYSLRNERAWKTMTYLMCNDSRFQMTKVYRQADHVIGFCTIITQSAEFWKTFLEHYGPLRFLWTKMFMPKEQEKITLPIDDEFLRRAKTRYETIEGKSYTFYIYKDSQYKDSFYAASFYEEIIRDLVQKGYKTLEAEIVPDNRTSIRMHERVGFEIRPIGDMYYAIKKLGE